MSLILDALRKSEAERRQMEAGMDPLASTVRPRGPAWAGTPPVWWWIVAGAGAIALLGAWLLVRPGSGDTVRASAPPGEASPAQDTPARMATESRRSTPWDARGMSTAAADTTPAETLDTGPTHGDAPGGDPGSAGRALPGTGAGAVPSGTQLSKPTPATVPSPAIADRPALAPAAVELPAPALAAARAPAAAPAPAPAAAMPAAAVSNTTLPRGDAVRLSDLGPAERQQLPPLRMSMHLWAPDAAKRFAILDGNRVVEGDRVGDAVVQSIDQDGVVLAWNGYRLRLPVR